MLFNYVSRLSFQQHKVPTASPDQPEELDSFMRPFAKLQKDKNNLALDRPYTGGRSPDICHILPTHHPCHSSSTEASNPLLVAHAVRTNTALHHSNATFKCGKGLRASCVLWWIWIQFADFLVLLPFYVGLISRADLC